MSESAFEPEVVGQVMIIQMARLYDVMFALLAEQSPSKAKELARLHSKGVVLSPPPSMILDGET